MIQSSKLKKIEIWTSSNHY